jgi:hypothetical protein
MKCEVCKTETNPGAFYIVRYGYESWNYLTYKKFLVTRQIDGSENVWICDPCLDRYVDQLALLVGLLIVFGIISVTLLLNLLQGHPVREEICPSVVGLLGGAYVYYMIKKDKRGKGRLQMGDKYAIRLIKPRLKRQGYKSFFTRKN